MAKTWRGKLTIGRHSGAEADLRSLRGVEALHGAHDPARPQLEVSLVSPARVEVDPLVPGRDEPLLGSHGRHWLRVALVRAGVALAGEGGGLGLGQLGHVLGAGGGEGRELGEAELVCLARLVTVLDTRVRDHRHSSSGGVPSTVLVRPAMRNNEWLAVLEVSGGRD